MFHRINTWRAVSVALLAVALVEGAMLYHQTGQKGAWAQRWEHQRAQFQHHLECMQRAGCNAMAMRPLPAQ